MEEEHYYGKAGRHLLSLQFLCVETYSTSTAQQTVFVFIVFFPVFRHLYFRVVMNEFSNVQIQAQHVSARSFFWKDFCTCSESIYGTLCRKTPRVSVQ